MACRPRGVLLVAGRQLLQAELADRLQHAEARLASRAGALCRTRLLSTSEAMPSRTSMPRIRPSPATASAASSVQPADEDGQAPEERLLGGVEQVVAPGDRVAQGPLPRRASRRLPPVSSGKPRSRRASSASGGSSLDAGGGQLDGQRQPVEPPADVGDGRRRSPRSARSRERRPGRAQRTAATRGDAARRSATAGAAWHPAAGKRRDGNSCSPRDLERLAARDQHRQARARGKQLATIGRRVETCSKLSSTTGAA